MRDYFLCSEQIGFSRWQEEDFKARLAKEIDNDAKYQVQYWPIFDRETQDFIGCCGLRPYDLEASIYELGF